MQRRFFLQSVGLGGAAALAATSKARATAAPPPMKITRIRFYHNPNSPAHFNQSYLRAAGRHPALVRLPTAAIDWAVIHSMHRAPGAPGLAPRRAITSSSLPRPRARSRLSRAGD